MHCSSLQQFILKKFGFSWDDTVCNGATLDDIDDKAVEFFIQKAIKAKRLPEESLSTSKKEILNNLNLIAPDEKIKNAAVILFGKNPSRFIAGTEFAVGRFGDSDSDLIFQDLLEGNIITICSRIVELLKSKYLISPIHYEGLQRIEPLEIPEDALREAIFNALVHKDYTGVHIQMKVFNDRIELWTSGIPDFPIEEIKKRHISSPRNKLIANAFYRAGFIEHWGRGVEKICTAFKTAGLAEPIFENLCNGTKIVIPRNKILTDESSVKSSVKIVSLIEENPEITLDEIASRLNLTKRAIEKQVKQLRENGTIVRIGADNGGHWEIVK